MQTLQRSTLQFALLFSMTLWVGLQAQAQVHESAPLFLEVGEQRLLEYPTLEKYSVSGNSVSYVRLPQKNQILIKATQAGITTVTVVLDSEHSETRTIRVEKPKRSAKQQELLQALSALKTTEVIRLGKHSILRGSVTNTKEASVIAKLLKSYPKELTSECTLDSEFLQTSQKQLEPLCQKYQLSLELIEGMPHIRGSIENPKTRASVEVALLRIQPLAQLNISSFSSTQPTLYFKVFLLEVRKDLLSKLGTDWNTPHAALFEFSPTKLWIHNSIDLSIQALSEKGMVQILSTPELVVRAPGKAELFAGGELPIRQSSRFSNSISWKSVGLSLKLDVTEFSGSRVRLSIETQMSHLDESLDHDEVPGIQSNRIKTQVDGTLGKPLFLSGLLQDDLRTKAKGLPALSKIPILGKLFGSEHYRKNRSELVAILLPYQEAPKNPQKRISPHLPSGFLPLPRSYVSAEERETLKDHQNFPWNVL